MKYRFPLRSLCVVAPMLCAAHAAADSQLQPVVVVIVAPPSVIDEGRVRGLIGRELGALVIRPDDKRAETAKGRLTIDARTSTSTVTVTYQKLRGKGENDPASAAIVRTVPLPTSQSRAESTVLILASNIARDEADDLLSGMGRSSPKSGRSERPGVDSLNAYERGAREYRDTVATILRLHYESKKKSVVSQLEQSLAIEKSELVKAREVAIQRLEQMIARHGVSEKSAGGASGDEIPNALFRLAALYEERSHAAESGDAANTNVRSSEHGLRAAIVLYQRILIDYPKYRERAAVHYFLGHALNDIGELADAQAAWRSLVCANHYSYKSTPSARVAMPLLGDADEAHWASWRRRYSTPASISKKNPETVYVEAFPDDCAPPPPTPRAADAASKYVAEAWWQIGSYEFDQLDAASGVTKESPTAVWSYNRAASAFVHGEKVVVDGGSVSAVRGEASQSPLYAPLLYKHAWTLFKQQRYELATKMFVKLLDVSSSPQDFHDEALVYIAGSLTSSDFRGPEDWEPFIVREDKQASPALSSASASAALDRVRDPALVPQDKPWTIEVYRALGIELRSMDRYASAIEVLETIQQKWPLDRAAPETQNAIAETYDQALVTMKPGTAEHEGATQKAVLARMKLASYLPTTAAPSAWATANKNDRKALEKADLLVRDGLHRAAVAHTNAARALLGSSGSGGDDRRALAEYTLAAEAWRPLSTSTSEARYWLADALHKSVRLSVKVGQHITAQELANAVNSALAVRDDASSSTSPPHRENAALFVVDLRDVDRDVAYALGTVPKREEVQFNSNDPNIRRTAIKDPIPPVVQQSINAREEFIRVMASSNDATTMKRRVEYEYWITDTLFLYGHWDLARPRFESMWRARCAVDGFGFKAWSRILTMATIEQDVARALALTEAVDVKRGGKSCDADGEMILVDPVRRAALQTRAQNRLVEVKAAANNKKEPPSAIAAKWLEVGELFAQALDAAMQTSTFTTAQADEDVPMLALSAGDAFMQAGQPAKAIALYKKAIARPASVNKASTSSPRAMAALGNVHNALVAAYFTLLDYPHAAEELMTLATHPRMAEAVRRDAAKNAVILLANMRDRKGMDAAHDLFVRLHPTAEDKASTDFVVAKASGNDAEMEVALIRFVDANANRTANPGSSQESSLRYVVEASSMVAEIRRARTGKADREWLARTVEVHDRVRRTLLDPRLEGLAAAAAFALIDEDIAKSFEAPPSKHLYPTNAADVWTTYLARAQEAKKWSDRLEREVITKYQSQEWVVAAWARQGEIFDALRSGLYFNTTNVNVMTAQARMLATSLRAANQAVAADKLEDTARDVWRAKKDAELEAADELMIDRFAKADAAARRLDVKNPHVAKARSRLAYFTEVLGESKMRKYVENTADPATKGTTKLTYEESMYARSKPGLSPPPQRDVESDPKPLPMVP